MRAIYRDPFSIGSPKQVTVLEGRTIAELVEICEVPSDFDSYGSVMVGDHEIPKDLWSKVRPKIDVTLHYRVRGGGGSDGGGSKNVLATVASIGIAIASSGIAAGGAARFLGAGFAAGTLGATALAGGVALLGSALLGALIPPPTSNISGESFDRDTQGAASASGNILEANGPIPRVIGTRKIFPPFATPPRFYYVGQDEFVETLFCLSGPHDLSDIRIDGVLAADAEDIQLDTREGWESDTQLGLITKQGSTQAVQIELSRHQEDPNDKDALLDADVSNLPFWHALSTSKEPDEFSIQLQFPQGLSEDGSDTNTHRIPFRVRIRPTGTTNWTNLPEIHFLEAATTPRKAEIRLIWQEGEQTSIPEVPLIGWAEVRKETEPQVLSPASDAWVADTYFSTGAGSDYSINGTIGNIKNIIITDTLCSIFLDVAQFPKGTYDVEIIRGAAMDDTSWSSSAYTFGGNVIDPFWYRGNDIIPNRSGIADTVFVSRTVSTWDEHPVGTGSSLALIAIIAKNRAVERVSVEASGYVPDYSGSAWDNWIITSNPVPHFRDALIGRLNLDPVPEDLLDDTGLLAWRSRCISSGYTCDHIAEGERLDDLLRIVASTGYARPYQSEIWGVIEDYDRSAETPVQIFTPRNTRGVVWEKAFARLPDAIRANFPVNDGDNTTDQIIVQRQGGGGTLVEQIRYEGLLTESLVRDRVDYDIGQLLYRAATYTIDAPAEAIVCRRGSMVGLAFDVLTRTIASGRITSIELDAGNVRYINLDNEVLVRNGTDLLAVTDILAESDIFELGTETGIAIRRSDNSITVHKLTGTSTTSRVEIETPFTDPGTIVAGALATVGDLGNEYRRMIVNEIEPNENLTATLKLVDEAQELWI